jgi:N-acetyl-gamma-glutamyl-phosphate reductase
MPRIVIIGASGYSGAELADILLHHQDSRVVGVFGSAKRETGDAAPQRFSDIWPKFRGRLDLPIRATDVAEVAALKPDAVFLATPHEASLELAPQLLAQCASAVVLDLSAAFRLKDAALYPSFYNFEHHHTRLLREAAYGLPELFRVAIAKASLIAVPGCYPTSAILPLAPLVKAGAVRVDSGKPCRVIIDSTSGVSGAGRTATTRNLFCEVSQSPYGVLSHRHNPEIDAYAGTPTLFTPHIGPYERGILSTIHVELAAGWTEQRVRETLAAAYAKEPFVRLLPARSWPAVNDVAHTNYCDIACAVDASFDPARPHLIIASALDNLIKGAAGQAVQCMNIRLGLEETRGLLA